MKKTNLDEWICETEHVPELTRKTLEAIQLKRLNLLLERARNTKGHYENLPQKLNDLDELKNLPFTTAQMLGANPGRYLLTSQAEVARVISGATSGTTGPAKRVFYTQTDTEHTVGLFQAGIGEMAQPGEKVFIAMPFSGPFGLGDLIAKAVERLNAIPVRAGIGLTWDQQKQILDREQPENYIGFPVPLLGLARFCGGTFPLKRALVSGDACPEGVMAELERFFPGETYPHYGSREMGLGGAVTCPAHAGMHLRENHVLAEIVDGDGNPLPDGQWGELVITTIGMEAMPLIRYRTGDRTRFLAEACPCGGVTRRLDRISRMCPGAVDMEQLDSRMFRFPQIVDYCVTGMEDGLRVRVSVIGAVTKKEILDALQTDAHVQIVPCGPGDLPFYPGKRYIRQALPE
ncbi:MAG: AMP-binding protein [Oscillospiraceae bacterium]|nr:AMP-binding protein [Oscillospiraceae bacterium]